MYKMGQLEFESKIRSKDNLREFFAIHHNLFFPKETCFNTNFIKQVFKGEKLLLGLNESYPPDLAYIKDANLFDKAALFKVIKDKPKFYVRGASPTLTSPPLFSPPPSPNFWHLPGVECESFFSIFYSLYKFIK